MRFDTFFAYSRWVERMDAECGQMKLTKKNEVKRRLSKFAVGKMIHIVDARFSRAWVGRISVIDYYHKRIVLSDAWYTNVSKEYSKFYIVEKDTIHEGSCEINIVTEKQAKELVEKYELVQNI